MKKDVQVYWTVSEDFNSWGPTRGSGSVNLRFRWLVRLFMWTLKKLSKEVG